MRHALAASLLLLPVIASGQEPPPPASDVGRWTWKMAADGAEPVTVLHVHNDYGDIRLRSAGLPVIEGWGVVQRLGTEPGAVGATVERRGGAVVLTVTYGPGRVQDADPRPAKDAMDRFDLAVFVPPGVRVEATTIRGLVEGRNLKNDVVARTLDEPITLATTGAVDARSETGDVTVFLQPGANGLTSVRTATGAVTLGVPRDAVEVRAESAGPITSEVGGAGSATAWRVAPVAPVALAVVRSKSGPVALRRTEPLPDEAP